MKLLKKVLTGCWSKLKQLTQNKEVLLTFELTKEDLDVLIDRAAKDAAIACISIVRQTESPPLIKPLNIGLTNKIIHSIKEKFHL